MPSLLEKISGHRKHVNAKARADYERLVSATEAGEDIAPADAVRVMDAVGKADADLADAVALIRQRRADAIEAAKLPAAERALAVLDRESLAAAAELKSAQDKYRMSVARIVAARPQLLGQIASSVRARDELARTCSDAAILSTERTIGAESVGLNRERDSILLALSDRPGTIGQEFARLTREAKGADSKVKNFVRSVGFNGPSIDAAAAREKRDAYEREHMAPLQKRLAAVENRRTAIAQQLAQLHTAKMEA